jgi:SAM-dependent methyltransferase
MTAAPPLFDRGLAAARAMRRSLPEPGILATSIAAELADRLAMINRRFGRALLIAREPAAIAARLRETGQIAALEVSHPAVSEDLALPEAHYDALVSVLDLQGVNDVPGALIQMRRALKPDGLLLACLFAGETLTELRQSWLAAEEALTGGVSPRVAPMIDVRELGGLLQRAGLAMPVADLDRVVVRYADALSLMREIRALGLGSALAGRSRRPVSRRLLAAAAAHYDKNFADHDGRIRATVEVAWITGWAPHESQPKPLKPGSATARLADALNVEEKKL